MSEPSEQALIAQLTRVASDFRQSDQIIWQMPTLAITLTSVIVAVSLNYVHNTIVSGFMLLIGSFFDFGIAVALSRHRLGADTRSHYLSLIEGQLHLLHLPIQSDEMLKFLPESFKHRSPKFLRGKNAFQFLLASVIVLCVTLFVLGTLQLLIGLIPWFTQLGFLKGYSPVSLGSS